jgi:fatty acid synthase
VAGLARTYRPLGPVLSVTVADHLKKVLGPAGARQASIADRVTGHWGLGAGWVAHVTAELALATRPGASIRGGDLGTVQIPTDVSGVTALVDASVAAVASRHGISVAAPTAAESTVDAAAIAGVTGEITDALASTARHLLARLGESGTVSTGDDTDDNAELLARVETELGPNWLGLTAPAFDANRAVLLDDRWASAREDVVRIAGGEAVDAEFAGAGRDVAAIARWFGLDDIAARADDATLGEWAAVVAETG